VYDYKQHRNQETLAALFLRYHQLLYGVCLKYLKDQEHAKDAVIEIYEQLVTKLVQHEVDNFKGWVYVLAGNHCLMQLRKNKHTLTKEITDEHMYSEDFSHPVNALLREKELNSLEACIEELGDVQKEIIKKFYLKEMSYNEISAATGLEWNKVRSLVQNGRRNLKICMERNEQ
jgi:RNA polymerase sigma factor (sigma-70 family)